MDEDTYYDLMSAVRSASLDKVLSLINAVDASRLRERSNGYFLILAAAEKDRSEVIELLLKKGCEVNEKSESRSTTPLHLAIKNGDPRIIEMLVDRQADLNAKDEKGKTPLRIAVERKIIKSRSLFPCNEAQRIDRDGQLKIKMDIVELILKRGADVDAVSDNGMTVLHYAINEGDGDVVSMLLNHGACANPNILHDRATSTPLHCAILKFRSDFVTLLLDNNADPNVEDADGRTALHLACTFYHEGNVRKLIDHGADVNRVCVSSKYEGYTPLHFASMRCNCAKVLLEKGARVDALAKDNFTPLHLAVRDRYYEVVRLLLENGANVDSRTKNGTTALQMAVKVGSSGCVETTLKHRPNLDDESNKLCVKWIVRSLTGNKKHRMQSYIDGQYAKIMEMLVEYGFPIETEDTRIPKLMYVAVKHRCFGLVEYLLHRGADANVKFENSTTPIGVAVKTGDARIVKILLWNGARVRDSRDLLNVAVRNPSREMVEMLLDHEVDVNATDENGTTALYSTALDFYKYNAGPFFDECQSVDVNARRDMAKLLLTRGSIVDARGKDGRTALHGAAELGDVGLVEKLLEHGADVNNVDQTGQSPLCLATANAHAEIVEKLLARGAIIRSTDKNEETLLHGPA